jgi:SAM-dependent methyltransferase
MKNKDFLNGDKLYGDDFDENQIRQWYIEEEEAYFELINNSKDYKYNYHAINQNLGFKYLPENNTYNHVVSFGGAYGDEIIPIIDKIKNLTIIEASENMRSDKLVNIIPKYIKPNISGVIDIESNEIDLITCFGVLHHIPNVSFVIKEFYRILNNDGILLLKEPIVSMGDWNFKRNGLTKNERGIPKVYFEKIITDAGFKIIKRNYCANPVARKLGDFFKIGFNSKIIIVIDKLLSKSTVHRYKYHPVTFLEKLQPQAVFYVLQKIK